MPEESSTSETVDTQHIDAVVTPPSVDFKIGTDGNITSNIGEGSLDLIFKDPSPTNPEPAIDPTPKFTFEYSERIQMGEETLQREYFTNNETGERVAQNNIVQDPNEMTESLYNPRADATSYDGGQTWVKPESTVLPDSEDEEGEQDSGEG